MSEPATAAGRALLERRSAFNGGKHASVTLPSEQWNEAILAIEAEARAPYTDPQDRWRLVRVAPDVLAQWGTRTDDGDRLTVEWGEPDNDGIYEPTFTRHTAASGDVEAELQMCGACFHPLHRGEPCGLSVRTRDAAEGFCYCEDTRETKETWADIIAKPHEEHDVFAVPQPRDLLSAALHHASTGCRGHTHHEHADAILAGLAGQGLILVRADPAASGDVEAALGRLSAIAASMVRAEGVCEKPHRNGEAHPHIHWGDSYIARARDIVWAGRVLRAAIRAESAGALDVERWYEAVSDSLAATTEGTDYAEAPEPSDEPKSPYVLRLTHELLSRLHSAEYARLAEDADDPRP